MAMWRLRGWKGVQCVWYNKDHGWVVAEIAGTMLSDDEKARMLPSMIPAEITDTLWIEIPSGPKSWAPEQKVAGRWYRNELRFRTEDEAKDNARDLHRRWTQSEAHRATEADEEPNYMYTSDGQLFQLPRDPSEAK